MCHHFTMSPFWVAGIVITYLLLGPGKWINKQRWSALAETWESGPGGKLMFGCSSLEWNGMGAPATGQ